MEEADHWKEKVAQEAETRRGQPSNAVLNERLFNALENDEI